MTPTGGAPQGDLFGGAMARLEPSLVREAPESMRFAELGQALPPTLRLGTSSWAFPGWAGIVYDRSAPVGALSRRGLEPYSRHPLFGCVGVDRTYYGPLPADRFEEYAALVPSDFRFLVKADRALTFPTFNRPNAPLSQSLQAQNPDFLNPIRALEQVLTPVASGLGPKLGVLLFQFPPMAPAAVGGPQRFAEALHRFLISLPTGLPYAVELRSQGLLTGEVRRVLGECNVALVRAVHPSLPPFAAQAADAHDETGPLVIRWMLGHGQPYEVAKDRYQPFNRLVDPDPVSRSAIADACIAAAAAGRQVFVIVNNKAEGSSPLSIIELTKEIVRKQDLERERSSE